MSQNSYPFLDYFSIFQTISLQSNPLIFAPIVSPASQSTSLMSTQVEIPFLEPSKIFENLFIPFCSENAEEKKSISQIQNKKIKIPFHDKSLKRTHSEITEKGTQKLPSRAPSEFKMETDLVEVDSAETDFHSPLHVIPIQNKSALIPHREIFSSASSLNQAPTPQQEIDFFFELQEIAKTLIMSDPIKKKLINDSCDPINIFPTSQNQQVTAIVTKKQTKINNKLSKKSKVQSLTQISSSEQIINNGHNNTLAMQQPNSTKTRKPRQQKQPKQLSKKSNNKQLNKKSNNPTKLAFAEEVYLKTFSEDGSIKLKKFPCFKESDLCIPTQYSQLIQQYSDDDKCSGDDLLEKAVNFLHKKLVASTIEMNPSAKIIDSDKVLTIKDIKIDRESEDEEDQDDEDSENNKYHSSYQNQQYSRRYSYSSKKTHNSYLSEDEDSDDDDVHINSFSN